MAAFRLHGRQGQGDGLSTSRKPQRHRAGTYGGDGVSLWSDVFYPYIIYIYNVIIIIYMFILMQDLIKCVQMNDNYFNIYIYINI